MESNPLDCLANHEVTTYTWRNVSVTVKDRRSKQEKLILDHVSGQAGPGDLIALMGPSGSGKTTLLNVLARRQLTGSARAEATLLTDGREATAEEFRSFSSFVEQDDTLIGSLTSRETIDIAARLSRTINLSKKDRGQLVQQLLNAFGLDSCADTLIGTPVRKGVSGGQKRRISVASQLVTAPKILFLDEPTSGLDSTASREVVNFIRNIAKSLNLIVIASIHQPSTDTFNLFDKLLLLSKGKTCYFGPVNNLDEYLHSVDLALPVHANPAEYLLDLVNVDFERSGAFISDSTDNNVERLHLKWRTGSKPPFLVQEACDAVSTDSEKWSARTRSRIDKSKSQTKILLALLDRAFIKSYRDLLAYGVRYAMYIGLAIMMGTVWLRLKTEDQYIQAFINSIFFGSAFMSFMAVAYVPAYLEDRAMYVKERANGLYGPTLFMLSNFIVGIPYLFGISLLFSLIVYFLINYQPTAAAFFTWVAWLFLDLLAAESLVVLLSSIVPNFVIALALTAFANGLWMCVGGFLIPIPLLNVFWKYVFHYIDYQAYVFQGMMVTEFQDRVFECVDQCQCGYPTGGLDCQVPGTEVLKVYGYATGRQGKWAGILIGIIMVYRLFGWIALAVRRT